MTVNKLLFKPKFFLIYLYIFIVFYSNSIKCDESNEQITLLKSNEVAKALKETREKYEILIKNEKNFYNYSIVCSGQDSRVSSDKIIDRTIPDERRKFILDTVDNPKDRANKCPQWNPNIESGSMETLTIPENTKVGERVYVLSATDVDNDPLQYFVRKSEKEQSLRPNEPLIFNISTIKSGSSWLGEVILAQELDFEKVNSYTYLTYAFDGENLIEKHSSIEITDVDDEKPSISIDHPNYNKLKQAFEFKFYENASLGEVLNENNRLEFNDVDTQNSQLKVKLVYVDSGLADSPFSLSSNGELRATSNLDFETQKQYSLKIVVRDVPGNVAEEYMNIEIMDVPDLAPVFTMPKENETSFKFFENRKGVVFNFKAVSSNQQPLGSIKYSLKSVDPRLADSVKLNKHKSNDTWYLEFVKPVSLIDQDKEETYTITINAVESADGSQKSSQKFSNILAAEKKFTIHLVSDDTCLPRFDKEHYSFDVVENTLMLLQPISVSDCDHGVNGEIYLSTNDSNFDFKSNRIYRDGNVAIQMLQPYDFEKLKTTDGTIDRKIEFEIYAKSSNSSINKYSTSALVTIYIKNVNEFSPKFILPAPSEGKSAGNQMVHSYRVNENEDYQIVLQAVDGDEGPDGEIFYSIKFLHDEDTLNLVTKLDSEKNLFYVTVPGRYLDAQSKVPIMFMVVAKNLGEPKLSDEIIIYLKAVPTHYRPIMFQYENYEFEMRENSKEKDTPPFKLRLIDDNMNRSNIILQELSDPLDLISFRFETLNDDLDDSESERIILLYPSNYSRDFDELFIKNNRSNIYHYKLRAIVENEDSLYRDVNVTFRLIDDNDNPPIISDENLNDDSVFYGSLSENFAPHSYVNLSKYSKIRFEDGDFSTEFGNQSLFFRIDDIRFQVDNEKLMQSSSNDDSEEKNNNLDLNTFIKVVASRDQFDIVKEPIVTLKLTVEDNYFNRRVNKKPFFKKVITVKIDLLDTNNYDPVFNQDVYLFNIFENTIGPLGIVEATDKDPEDTITYEIEAHDGQDNLINQYFRINSINNTIIIKKPFDYESGQRFYNFTVVARNNRPPIPPAVGYARAQCVVMVKDRNDNDPQFSQGRYNFLITKQKVAPNYLVGSIFATDLDRIDWNNKLTFTISRDNAKSSVKNLNIDEIFSLERIKMKEGIEMSSFGMLQGVNIRNKIPLLEDQEKSVSNSNNNNEEEENDKYSSSDFEFDIVVTDQSGHSATSRVIIQISTTFSPYQNLEWITTNGSSNNDGYIYSTSVTENSPKDTFVLQVQVDTSKLSDQIKSNLRYIFLEQSRYYRIDELTGKIYTTNYSIDREEINLYEQSRQTYLFVQAHYTLNGNNNSLPTRVKRHIDAKTKSYWSPIASIQIKITDMNDNEPDFLIPPNNQTVLFVTKEKLLENSLFIYKFVAIDSDSNDNVTYKLHSQNSYEGNVENYVLDKEFVTKTFSEQLRLPFSLNETTGEMYFHPSKLSRADYIMLMNHPEDIYKIRLTIHAVDSANNTAVAYLFVEMKFDDLNEVIKETSEESDIPPVEFEIVVSNRTGLSQAAANRTQNPNDSTSPVTIGKDTENTTSDPAKEITEPLIKPIGKSVDDSGITFNFSINELTEPNSVIAQIVSSVDKKKLNRMPANLKLVPTELFNKRINDIIANKNNKTGNATEFTSPEELIEATEKINSYFDYDPINGEIKLKRKLNWADIKNMSFSLVDKDALNNILSKDVNQTALENFVNENKVNPIINTNDGSGSSSNSSIGSGSTGSSGSGKNPNLKRVNFNIIVKDENDQPPELVLDQQEIKDGKNLILVSVDNPSELLPSNVNISEVIAQANNGTVDKSKGPSIASLIPIDYLNAVLNFNKKSQLKAYKISDSDEVKNFTAYFSNETSPEVREKYNITTNGTHVIFKLNEDYLNKTLLNSLEKKTKPRVNSTTSINGEKQPGSTSESNDEDLLSDMFDRFSIVVDDGKHKTKYKGDIYDLNAKSVKNMITFPPTQGVFKGQVYRSSVWNTKIDMDPPVSIKNPMPFDLHIELEDKDQEKYIDYHPKIIRTEPHNSIKTPIEIVFSLKKPLSELKELSNWSTLNLNLLFKTNNSYMNDLFKALGPIQTHLDILEENKHQPRITVIEPMSRRIELTEGVYENYKIGSIRAVDKDTRDPGRLEYYIIGPSIVEINKTSGDIFLNGIIDAESSEQLITFHCYARDLAPKPFAMQSELVAFELSILDVNEHTPILQPTLYFLIIKEEDQSIIHPPNYIKDFQFDCYDKDLNSSSQLSINIESVRFVSIHDTDTFIDDDSSTFKTDTFKIVVDDELKSQKSSNNRPLKYNKKAHLALTQKLDYESLVKPNETLIRVDVHCTDGTFKSESRVLIKVEDVNDHVPKFINPKHQIITKDESVQSAQSQLITQLKAYDQDMSPQYGNASLVYSISSCVPDVYMIDVNEKSGDVYSRLLIDADTKELVDYRAKVYRETGQSQQIMQQNNITCDLVVKDAFGVGNSTHEDKMKITILIVNVNDNAPVVHLDKQTDNTIEVLEGVQTRGERLMQIPISDLDDATGLKCVFSSGLTVLDPFELRTAHNRSDPHRASCELKVSDLTYLKYDPIKSSNLLLDIIVEDRAKPPVGPNPGRTSFQVRIKIIPVNDDAPQFLNGKEETFFTVDSVKPGTRLGAILATDSEVLNPQRLIYKLDEETNKENLFELIQENSTNTYWGSVALVTKGKLDFKSSPYILRIYAYDGEIGMADTLNSTKIVYVQVINQGSFSVWVNSTNGESVEIYKVNLLEKLAEDSLVVKVHAIVPSFNTTGKSESERDDEKELIYSIENDLSTQQNPFYKIDSKSGEIRTTKEQIRFEETNLDRIRLAREIKIRARTKDGYHSYQTYVSVNVIDINDHAPIFDKPGKICVVENTTSYDGSSVIGKVNARDFDSGPNGLVMYELVLDNDQELKEGQASLRDIFEVNKLDGSIRVVNGKLIDREASDYLKLKIRAYDQGVPSLNSTILVDICVLDINDNQPEFDRNVKTVFEIAENTISFSHTFKAIDRDLKQNGTVFYYIDNEKQVSKNTDEIGRKFLIDPTTGRLTLNSPLDYEEKSQYEIVITAIDNGEPIQLSTDLTITINVLDLNDNEPKFSKRNPKISRIIENSPADTIIARFEAVDLDKNPENNSTSYTIKSVSAKARLRRSSDDADEETNVPNDPEQQSVEIEPASLFSLDKKTGVLRLKEPNKLSYANYSQYTLVIEAFDEKKPEEFRDSFNFTLEVLPSNDKLPLFVPDDTYESTLYRNSLKETPGSSFVVEIVKAIELNEHEVRYSIETIEEFANGSRVAGKSRGDLFTIGAKDGVIKTIKPRSFYTANIYKLHVRATSTLSSTLVANATVEVRIDSSRDSLFEQQVYEVSVEENSSRDKVIFKLVPKALIKQSEKFGYKINSLQSVPSKICSEWFKIDASTGVISTNSIEIDYEKYSEVLLVVDVFDMEDDSDHKQEIESILIKISIVDVNDNKPAFDVFYQYEINMDEDSEESAKSERNITYFSAFDLDGTSPNNLIDYQIISVESSKGNNYLLKQSDTFKLVPQESSRSLDEPFRGSEMRLVKVAGFNLDRDMYGNEISIRIMAKDRGVKPDKLFSMKTVRILLNDVNDNAPTIMNSDKSEIVISEDQAPFQPFFRVIAIDKDEGLNSELVYEIDDETSNVDQQPSKHVGIDQTGNLFLKHKIEYETEQEINFLVKIFDKSQNPLKTKKAYKIKILNVNDNYPRFKNIPKLSASATDNDYLDDFECQFRVNEGPTSRNQVLYKFEAVDDDKVSGPFEYEIVELTTLSSSNFGESKPSYKKISNTLFQMDKLTGELKVRNGVEFDREQRDNYQLLISVKDQEINKGDQLTTTLRCYVQILDINDNAPRFDERALTNIKLLPLINQINVINSYSATDPDLANNGTIVYSLLINDYYNVESPNVWFNSSQHNLFEINERGHLIMRPFTKDNASMSHPDLDDIYKLKIIARDLGRPQLETQLDVTIHIDSAYFQTSQLAETKKANGLKLESSLGDQIEVKENTAEQFVTQIFATNSYAAIIEQTGTSNKRPVTLKYTLLTATNVFSINETSGHITVKNASLIDYETTKFYWLTIEAVEEQRMSIIENVRTGKYMLFIRVKNINDNPPEFNSVAYEAYVNENEKQTPYEVNLNQTIIISDKDIDENDLPTDQLNPLDIRLIGKDSRYFNLVKLDTSIRGNQIDSAFVNYGNVFYKLEALDRFDYELKQLYEFSIEVGDGKYKRSANVLINIVDLNDNEPEFAQKVYEFSIPELSPFNSLVGSLNATDRDLSTKNKEIKYVIDSILIAPGPLYTDEPKEQEMSQYLLREYDFKFRINAETGAIYVNYGDFKLDRESVLYYNLSILAYNKEDRDMYDTCNVIIRLEDVNDNAPKFESSYYLIEMKEKSPVGRQLLRLNAIDNDLSENGTVRYKISRINRIPYDNIDAPAFKIGDKSGILTLNSFIDIDDREWDAKNFEILVVAYDLGSPSLTQSCTVAVNVLDINDHEPEMISKKDQVIRVEENNEFYSFKTPESSSLNKPLTRIEAIDPDNTHSKLNYTLDEDINGDWSYFHIDKSTGELYANFSFDYEKKTVYNLKVRVTDNGYRYNEKETRNGSLITMTSGETMLVNDAKLAYPYQMSTTCNVRVEIIDTDDNEPEFQLDEPVLVINVGENTEPGSSIQFLPQAIDRDSNQYNTARYLIVSGNIDDKFSVNETTGELLLNEFLEKLELDSYMLTIKATSKSGVNAINYGSIQPGDKSFIKVQINVLQENVFMEFDRLDHYVSLPLFNESLSSVLAKMESSSPNMSTLLKNAWQVSLESTNNVGVDSLIDNNIDREHLALLKRQKSLLTSSIFYSRAHLKLIKEKRKVVFEIEDVKLIPYKKTSSIKLSNEVFSNENLINSDESTIFSMGGETLFKIDSRNGKVYANRLLIQKKYNLGDRFVLSLGARSDKFNLTVSTDLHVTLSVKDFGFMYPTRGQEAQIVATRLNPRNQFYLPRLFEIGGFKFTIQDLVKSNITTAIANSVDIEEQQHHEGEQYEVIMQAYKSSSFEFVDLEFLKSLANSVSTSNENMKEFQNFKNRALNEPLLSNYSIENSDSRTFYTNWLFWLLMVICVLLFVLIIAIVCCLKTNGANYHQKKKQSGLLIEYPPGVTPSFNDGVLNLNPSREISNSMRSSQRPASVLMLNPNQPQVPRGDENFEDQEMIIDLNYDSD